jgi:hypothetical protein
MKLDDTLSIYIHFINKEKNMNVKNKGHHEEDLFLIIDQNEETSEMLCNLVNCTCN